ncbi:MAG: hypothetical protein IJZ30_00955 [Alphaproteobacteria bacterium]|nr:hypothetical protein [Alphaproteobacteria bacterium]
MMKKFFLLFVLCVMGTHCFADELGCDNITNEEMEKAKSVLKEAQEIVLLSYPKAKIVKFEDIIFNEQFLENDEYRKFIIEDKEYGANYLFVRLAENTKYLNLGLFIGCEFMSSFDVMNIREDRVVEVKHSVKTAEEKFKQCDEKRFSADEKINEYDDLVNSIEKKTECYKSALFEFFDAVHPSNSYDYKKSFDDMIEKYRIVRKNMYYIQDEYMPPISVGTSIAADVKEFVKKEVKDYFEEYHN